jgi:hypothetical protein
MHARNRLERDRIVAQIREEYGIPLGPEEFTSHHTAADYLERIRLARQAAAAGIEVDPDAFGDDEFMRRHIVTLLHGAEQQSQDLATAGSNFAKPTVPVLTGPGCRDYIFVFGHRYYPDGYGAYIREDGTVLDPGPARVRGNAAIDAQDDPVRPGLIPTGESLADLDKLLDMLLPHGAEGG